MTATGIRCPVASSGVLAKGKALAPRLQRVLALQDHCRMSYEQSILEAPERQCSLLLSAISKALFEIPNGHRAWLECIWVDQLTYTSSWRKYVSGRIEDIKLIMILVSQTLHESHNICAHTFFSPKLSVDVSNLS